MAGERKGKTYEAILKVALDRLKSSGKIRGEIFWNKTPSGMTIEPDFTIGDDLDSPKAVIMVTHGGSAKESNRKYWRNIGELVEAKVNLRFMPHVYGVTFDSIIKEDIKLIEASSLDGCLVVGDLKYGKALQKWVDANDDALPTKAEDKAEEIRRLVGSDKTLMGLFKERATDVEVTLRQSRPDLDQLWTMDRVRKSGRAPVARDTAYRRGLTKALVLGFQPSAAKKPIAAGGDWLVRLGLAKKSLGGLRVADKDLLMVANSPLSQIGPADWPSSCISQGFRDQLSKVKSLAMVVEFERYVKTNLADLKTVKGMESHLLKLHKNPSHGLALPPELDPPTNVWLFDFIGALVKARAKKSQAFGYSTFAKHPDGATSRIGNMQVGTWCSCFMNQFFSRRPSFSAPKEAVSFAAKVLSEQVAKFSATEIDGLASDLENQYIAKEYEATLLAHRGFDPIGGLISLRAGLAGAKELRVQACFAERALTDKGSGSTSVLRAGSTLINWQSAHGSHTSDKTKELCGRAIGLRYTWSEERKKFMPRHGVRKLILIVDGTWTQSNLDALARAGWDEILYPDEIDRLAKAIV